MRLEKKIKQLEFELVNKKSEYDIIKLNYDILSEKTSNLDKKFSNIYNLFDEALQKLSEDKNLKKVNQLHLNIDEVQKADFSSLKPEDRYSVLCILTNLLLPLIKKDYQEKNELIKSNSVIKFKYSFRKEDPNPKQQSSKQLRKTTFTFKFPKVSKTKEKALPHKRFEFTQFGLF
jgi:hypothetical protein